MIRVAEVLDAAGRILKDAGYRHWTQPELLAWVRLALLEILLHKPEAGAVRRALTLVPGTTAQALPDGTLRLLNVIRNLSAAGAPGAPVRLIQRQQFDLERPSWHTDAARAEVRHVMADADTPRDYWVWPKPAAASKVEAIVTEEPPAALTADAEIDMEATFTAAAIDYVLFRCWSKDAEETFNAERAIAHYNAFAAALGLAKAQPSANSRAPGGVAHPQVS